MKCSHCSGDSVYKCSACGKPICGTHAKIRTICPSCLRKKLVKFKVEKATSEKEKTEIRNLVRKFWGEEQQLTFGRTFTVANLPAYIAEVGAKIVGFISFAEIEDALIIVALGILPEYQSSGIGKALTTKVEIEAKRLVKKQLLVSTSNDDLPALAFYQSLGFQIYEVKPNVIAEKHGSVLRGIGNLPIRDELRLRRTLN